MFITATLIGTLGIVANVIVYQQENGKKLLIHKLISDFLWATHYALLGAYSAVAVAVIGIIRETLFLNQNKKGRNSKLWLVFFLILSVLSAIFTWKNCFSILPTMASVLSVISFWKNDPRISRGLSFPISTSMLIYDIFCGSYTGIGNEIFTLISSTIGILRHSDKTSTNGCLTRKKVR